MRLVSIVAVLVAVAGGCSRETGLERLAESRRLAGDLHLQFAKNADAGNRAVMADNDDVAAALVAEAHDARAAVERDADTLAPLLAGLGYEPEAELLRGFRRQLAEYEKLDREILALALENTNVKAQRLSFGQARQAAESFGALLDGVSAAAPSQWHVKALAASALANVRQIQALQAPHIAERDDAAMTALEQQMAAAETGARQQLSDLEMLVAPAARARLTEARGALDEFMAVHREIIALSRRNTDVRSTALSLNEKGKLTAECEATLGALQDALRKRGVMGTR
jgi:hypothetical protein